jgi:hypothetical protein
MIPFVLALFASVTALVSIYKASLIPKIVEEEGIKVIEHLEMTLDETLKPINHAISASYSQLGTKGATAKQEKALDKRIAQDMLSLQDPMIQAGLEMFPNVREYVEKNPELLIKLLPRLQQLQSIEGFNPMDLISPSPGNPIPTAKHPYGTKEQ